MITLPNNLYQTYMTEMYSPVDNKENTFALDSSDPIGAVSRLYDFFESKKIFSESEIETLIRMFLNETDVASHPDISGQPNFAQRAGQVAADRAERRRAQAAQQRSTASSSTSTASSSTATPPRSSSSTSTPPSSSSKPRPSTSTPSTSNSPRPSQINSSPARILQTVARASAKGASTPEVPTTSGRPIRPLRVSGPPTR